MKGIEEYDKFIQNLESLLDLYPFKGEIGVENESEKSDDYYSDLHQRLDKYPIPPLPPVTTISNPQYSEYTDFLINTFKGVESVVAKQYAESDFARETPPEPTIISKLYERMKNDPKIILYNQGQHGSLSNVIRSLSDGSTLIIPKGTYNEPLVLNRSITIVGDGAVQIRSSSNSDTLYCTSTNAIIEGITFHFAGNNSLSAAIIQAGEAQFIRCSFIGTHAPSVIVKSLAKASFYSCQFRDSDEKTLIVTENAIAKCVKCIFTQGKNGGVYLQEKSSTLLLGCEIVNNGSDGVTILSEASAILRECSISGNKANGVVIASSSQHIALRRNEISNHANGIGVTITGKSKVVFSSNNCHSNRMCIRLNDSSQLQSVKNIFSNSPGQPLIALFNKTSFISEQDEMQGSCTDAILLTNNAVLEATKLKIHHIEKFGISADSNASLTISDSLFEHTGDSFFRLIQNAVFNVSKSVFKDISPSIQNEGVCVFYHSTSGKFIDCQFKKSTGHHLLFGNCSGSISFEATSFSGSSKAISMIIGQSSPSFSNCTFNFTNDSAAIISESSSCPKFDTCSFIGNESNKKSTRGVLVSNGATPIFKNSSFTKCGAGASIDSSDPTFEDCSFTFNNVGIEILNGSKPELKGTKIHSNLKCGVIITNYGTSPRFYECKIYSNTLSMGARVAEKATPIFEKCSFYENYNYHIDIRTAAFAKLTECSFAMSSMGVGIFVGPQLDEIRNGQTEEQMGLAYVKGCKIHDESQTGIFVHYGKVTIEECEIFGCLTAIRMENANSQGTITKNHIHDNAQDGIFILDGVASITENVISNHNDSGVVFSSVSVTKNDAKNNTFSGNRVKNIEVRN